MCISACSIFVIPGLVIMIAGIIFAVFISAKKRKDKKFNQYVLLAVLFFIAGYYLFTGCDPVDFLLCGISPDICPLTFAIC